MRRLPEDRMLDRLLAAGQVDSDYDSRYCGADRGISRERPVESWMDLRFGGGDLAQRDRGHRAERESSSVTRFAKIQFTAIDSFCRAFITAHWRPLNDRALEGRVREGHGDLRAEHICLAGQ